MRVHSCKRDRKVSYRRSPSWEPEEDPLSSGGRTPSARLLLVGEHTCVKIPASNSRATPPHFRLKTNKPNLKRNLKTIRQPVTETLLPAARCSCASGEADGVLGGGGGGGGGVLIGAQIALKATSCLRLERGRDWGRVT